MTQAPAQPVIGSYAAFWPYYLGEHARPVTRVVHIAGTLAAMALLVAAILESSPLLFALALVAGYGPAWAIHFFVEKNRPATLRYPVWSLVSDLRMTLVWCGGGLAGELEKAGIRTPKGPRG